jgi:hypothetical protein
MLPNQRLSLYTWRITQVEGNDEELELKSAGFLSGSLLLSFKKKNSDPAIAITIRNLRKTIHAETAKWLLVLLIL